MGRHKKEINWQLVEKQMEAGCTAREISAALRIDESNFGKRFKEQYGKYFSDINEHFRSAGDANLRAIQYAKALSGNIQMLFFLGKERLGQGKEQERISPFDDLLELKHDNMKLRAELAALREKPSAD